MGTAEAGREYETWEVNTRRVALVFPAGKVQPTFPLSMISYRGPLRTCICRRARGLSPVEASPSPFSVHKDVYPI